MSEPGGDMFGHPDDQVDQQNDNQAMDQGVNAVVAEDSSLPAISQSFTPPATPDPSVASVPATVTPTFTSPTYSPPAEPVAPSEPAVAPNADQPDEVDANSLLDLKQQALGQLSPLVGHLDQTPEEKFRTTMMMIQASDNQALIKDAYEAAQQIPDEKTRAQALLDVINEINYFTQHAAE